MIANLKLGPKLIIIDSYPLHRQIEALLSSYQTYVLYVPEGMTWALQPLDLGYHKSFKDVLRTKWVSNQGRRQLQHENEKRAYLAKELKEVWFEMADRDHTVYWEKAGLYYPEEDVAFRMQRTMSLIQNNFDMENTQSQPSAMEIEDQ